MWQDIIRRMLQPIEIEDRNKRRITFEPHTNDGWGWRLIKGKPELHRGGDFNYNIGQTGINLTHPVIRSPIAGIVTNAGQGKYGTIAIRDTNGFSHEILHTHSRHVAIGDPVAAGQIVGTMGNTGVDHAYVEQGQQHVHYQIRDPAGNPLNPIEFWDQQGHFDPAPPSPANLQDYNRYLGRPGAAGSPASPRGSAGAPAGIPTTFGTNGQFWPGSASSSQPLYDTNRLVGPLSASEDESNDVRRLTRVVPKADLGGYNPNARATTLNANDPPSFNDRFGIWTSSPPVSGPLGRYQPVVPPRQPGKAVGLITGQPMPDIPLPPSVWGLPDDVDTTGDDEWSLRRLKQKW
ncbi:M23 family metallopeptidase [Bradyrhizobium sp. Tv2a-2]|uniref:M23 family metallopeptidase n=1 Tax=Bradyrhizobium sp. Tv2a-2 TaxID=113395 RepID=UPI00041D9D6D|nr:M23 family metallopeptidase [Bradyrhizobium sp. Tv2a-2]